MGNINNTRTDGVSPSPCAFCNWDKIRVIEEVVKKGVLKGSKYTYCWCKVCGAKGPWAYSVDEDIDTVIKKCIERWNERGGIKPK